jgi:hypothetical protein
MSYHIVYDPVTGKIIEQYEQDEVKELDQSQTLYELGIIHERERILKLWNDWCDYYATVTIEELSKSVADGEWNSETSREYFINLVNNKVFITSAQTEQLANDLFEE